MDTTVVTTLVKRRDELLNELKHIDELIKIYHVPQLSTVPPKDSTPRFTRTKFNHRGKDVKGQVLSILKELGEEFYVSDLIKALKEKEPNKSNDLISNKARNYIYILKKEGIISGRLVENNKYVYKVVNK